MELALSLGGGGDAGPRTLSSLDHKELGFCIGLSTRSYQDQRLVEVSSSDPAVQLDLLPFSPVLHKHTQQKPSSQLVRLLPWLTRDKLMSGRGCSVDMIHHSQAVISVEEGDEAAASSFQMARNYLMNDKKRDYVENERACSRTSDEDENDNALTRKKLRLSKDQSAFLEGSFKEHSSLNPKQKLALAKQLNLRPRQVEVWFQNRRARTKLKQTEVDCEYLKRRCETLGEENKRLQKEVQELRALKTSLPFYNQLPPTTLTMCPSCERVASTSSAAVTTTATNSPSSSVDDKPTLMFPFFQDQSHMHQAH